MTLRVSGTRHGEFKLRVQLRVQSGPFQQGDGQSHSVDVPRFGCSEIVTGD